MEVECNKHKAEASELVAKLAVAEASSATPAGTEYLRNSASMTLGLTAEHETLLGMLQAAEQRADSFSELNFKLKGTLQVGAGPGLVCLAGSCTQLVELKGTRDTRANLAYLPMDANVTAV